MPKESKRATPPLAASTNGGDIGGVVEESQTPAKRKYRRQRLKKQLTVRIDENLVKTAMLRADAEGLRLTDALEDGLWTWVQQKYPADVPLRGRFLWNQIPLELQNLTLDFWALVTDRRASRVEKVWRSGVIEMLVAYRETEAGRRQESLRELGGEMPSGGDPSLLKNQGAET